MFSSPQISVTISIICLFTVKGTWDMWGKLIEIFLSFLVFTIRNIGCGLVQSFTEVEQITVTLPTAEDY